MRNIRTYQDFEKALGDAGKERFILEAINEYRASGEYANMLEAEAYFLSENSGIMNRPKWRMKKSGREITFSKNITISSFFFRFVVQLNQFLLAYGVQLEKGEYKRALGAGFDNLFEEAGEMALIHGVCWLFFDNTAVRKFEATQFFALFDERTGEPKAGIRFWQIDEDKPLYVELYEADGVTEYIADAGGNRLSVMREKRAYKTAVRQYGVKLPAETENAENYSSFPVVPFYANRHHVSEFTKAIKTKIDLYDKIFSDFGDNLERTNDVYWVISNFGGTTDEIKEMLADIEEIRATYALSDGSGSSGAQPHTIEVPYAARQVALSLLEKALYADFMALNMSEITGGSLTNVAIDTAKFNLEIKCNRYEHQAFQAVRKLLRLAGIETENIKFRRQAIANKTENINNVIAEYQAGLLDLETAVGKLDNVDVDEVLAVLERLALGETGTPAGDGGKAARADWNEAESRAR